MATDILYSNTVLLVFRLLRHALMNDVGALNHITAAVIGDELEKAKQKVSFCSQIS